MFASNLYSCPYDIINFDARQVVLYKNTYLNIRFFMLNLSAYLYNVTVREGYVLEIIKKILEKSGSPLNAKTPTIAFLGDSVTGGVL